MFEAMGVFRLKKIKKYIKDIDLAVETGTFKGDGTRVMANSFKNVITIELDPTLHQQTSKKFEDEGYNNVEFLLGDSGEVIDDLTKRLKEPAMFYLDAHWSGDASVDWESSDWEGYKTDTAHIGKDEKPTSQEQVPLDREVLAIANNFECRGVIYIDDLDKFSFSGKGLKNKAFKGEDYSHLDLKMFRTYLGTRLTTWKNLKSKQLIIKFDKLPQTSSEKFQQKLYFNTLFKLKFFADNSYRYLRWLIKGK